MKFVIRHYAFQEGQRGFGNGCGIEANPYYPQNDPDGAYVDQSFSESATQWRDGWKHENERAQKLKKALF